MAIEKIPVAAVTEEAGSGKLLKQKKIVSPSKKPTKSLKKVENSSLNIHLDMDTVWPLSENVSKTKDKIGKLKPTISSFVKTKVTTNKQRITEKKAVKKTGRVAIISKKSELKKIIFQLRFQTQYGQQLFIMGDHALLGNSLLEAAIPLQYFNDEYWNLELELPVNTVLEKSITYHYILRNSDGIFNYDWGNDKTINPKIIQSEELLVIDSWNFAGYFENSFYSDPFKKVLLKANIPIVKVTLPKKITHTLKVKTPLLPQGQTLCVLGSCTALGDWDTDKPCLMSREADDDFYSLSLNLSRNTFPITYKYGVYDVEKNKFLFFENLNNRVLAYIGIANRQIILNDGFAVLPNNTWKGAGIAIPVFSLRSENSFGIGEFSDLALLVDWAKITGLKMIQLLPINDTTATHTWTDSYPYAAISAFALNPIYLNLEKISGENNHKRLHKLTAERVRLNSLPVVDYEAVSKIKREYISAIYKETKAATFASEGYKKYFFQNQHWLVPYAAFCYLRDEYGTVDFSRWPAFKSYQEEEINVLADKNSDAFTEIGLHYYIQYQLHLQLQEATSYAHANGIILKGDIAIGVYRHGADAWQNPELYHLDFQAGAPPDDFAVTGQNWGFPIYNWQHMREDGFAWWKQRFEQMHDYFDAFRIDHILGFFRIWAIPMESVEGIMGHFIPSIPIHINEFNSAGIWFDYERYTQPYITENVLWEIFGYDNELVKSLFLNYNGFDNYSLKSEFKTQRQVENYFQSLEKDSHHEKIQQGMFNLISNVILFTEENSNGQQFHFRFAMGNTSSFINLGKETQQQLKELYINYFFQRQDGFWMKEALQKLPSLKRVTNMLICGEDLGLVPGCVPEVMRQLGLLSLEIQRMPKNSGKDFFHPNDAPYMSVVTPSTHDMSTIRGWWEEDRERIQKFYNNEMGQWGEAPLYCEDWINRAIVLQHLYSPAMWSVFQMQDLLGMDELLRRENPNEERINVPADPKHYWQYRMHITLEDLIQADSFNAELKNFISDSGRGE